jgi:hypothetical protein
MARSHSLSSSLYCRPPSLKKDNGIWSDYGRLSSLQRFFHPASRSVDDDLAELEKSFRNSSFAPVPSALTPSRGLSNSAIAATRELFFNRTVPLDFPSGWEKGPVTDWYNKQKAKGSTVIKNIQLRKDHQHPYYHEYIIISTRSGHTYRIDRTPDPDAPFDTIMKNGCIAHDTIQEVGPTSLKELDSTSSCVVELHWQSESKESLDLLFVLSICFAIHNDKWADRYTLQRYNCYFLSWAIIVITMRKSAVCRAVFDTGKVQGDEEAELEGELVLVLTRELDRELDPKLAEVLGRMLGRGLAPVLTRELTRELMRAPVRMTRGRELGQEVGQERELAWARARTRARMRTWAQELLRAQGRELAGAWARGLAPVLGRELGRELGRGGERDRAQEWVHGLGQIPFVLGPRKIILSRQVDFVI